MYTSHVATTPVKPGWIARPQRGHAVQFHAGGQRLAGSLATFLRAGLTRGERCVMIATDQHRREVEALLASRFNIRELHTREQLVSLDAARYLKQCTQGGRPDREAFLEALGPVVHTSGKQPRVRVFSDMAALLWKEGNADAALQIERLWNELVARHDLSLYCAYPSYHFDDTDRHRELRHEIIATHTAFV